MSIAERQYEVYIRATREEVWHALLDPEMTRQYFHGTAFDRPPAQGQPFSTSIVDGRPAVDGTIEVLEPPHRMVHTWHTLYDAELADEPVSRVEWIVETADVDADWHRMQAVDANNSTWELIGQVSRTAADDEAMLHRAYASRYHWARASGRGPANLARGAWLVAKVQLLVGEPTTSLRYADECLALCEEHGLADFDLAHAHEARGRALQALGRDEEAALAWKSAHAVAIADPQDRALLAADLAEGP